MTTKDIKDFLFEKTGVYDKNWKRISKNKTDNGYVRVFENKIDKTTIVTLESESGEFSVIELNEDTFKNSSSNSNGAAPNQIKKAKVLVRKFYEDGEVPKPDAVGFSDIPKVFRFSFMEDANPDHSGALENASNANDKSVVVTGFNVMMVAKDADFEDYSCQHIEDLIKSFLPGFMQETEESSFCIYSETQHIYDDERLDAIESGKIPNIRYDEFVATLEAQGFQYDKSSCMLANLGGSAGAKPLLIGSASEQSKRNSI